VTDAAGRYKILGLARASTYSRRCAGRCASSRGCGNGAQDVAQSRAVEVPLAEARQADFRIEGFLAAPRVGEPAPAFDARTVDGRPLALAGLRGKVVLLDFWATWCGSCRLELPRLIDDYARFGKDGRFEIVASASTRTRTSCRASSSKPRAPLAADRGSTRREEPIARLFNVNSTPATVLVDAGGKESLP